MHPYLTPIAIFVGVALLWGSIDDGYMADDHIQNIMIDGAPKFGWDNVAPWDLYFFWRWRRSNPKANECVGDCTLVGIA